MYKKGWIDVFIKKSASDYVKIALHRYIKQMDLREGTKLPTERELAALFAVSRSTVRDALEDMEADGVVIRQHGKGTYANPEALHIQANINPTGICPDDPKKRTRRPYGAGLY